MLPVTEARSNSERSLTSRSALLLRSPETKSNISHILTFQPSGNHPGHPYIQPGQFGEVSLRGQLKPPEIQSYQ